MKNLRMLSQCSLLVLCLLMLGADTLHAQCGTNTALGGQSGCARSNFYLGEWLPNAGCGTPTTINNYGPGYYFRMPVLQGGCYSVTTCGAGIDTHINAFEGANTTGPFAYDDDSGPLCTGLAASIIMTPNFTDYARIDVRQYPCSAGGTSSITVQLWQNNNLSFTSSSANMCQGTTRGLTAVPATVVVTPQVGSGDVGTFSGTGVSGTTFTAPTPGTSSQVYTLTYTFGYCTTTQGITVYRNPSTAAAGADILACGTTATLAATTPTYGTGSWSVVSGPGTVTTASNPTSTVTGLVIGSPTILRWTVSNGPCAASTDDVTVTVDNVLPSISCPTNLSVPATSGQCAAIVSYTTPSGSDNCPGSTTTLVSGLSSGSSFPVGTTANTFRVTDVGGNTATCTFSVQVSDNQVPAISCPGNASLTASFGQCSSSYTYTAPVGTDNCAGPSTTQTAGLVSGSNFPVGSTVNTFRVTDASGNTATCSFSVTVTDGQLPGITCPANQSVTNTTGQCAATVSFSGPSASDNCAGVTTTLVSGLASGSSFPIGTTTNVYRATDASGNSATCSMTVTVSDGQAPSITCPSNATINASLGQCSATYAFTAPSGTDNCAGVTTTQTAGFPSGSIFPVGTTSNVFRATDASGNTSSCTFTVTVADVELPSVNCPPNFSANVDPGQCSAVIPYPNPSASDNCPGATATLVSGLASGATFPIGNTTTVWRATDASGNSTTCSFVATIVDNIAPVVNCPTNQSITASVGACSATASYTAPTGTDNCPGVTGTQTAGLTSGATFPIGVTTNSFQVTDASGNTGTCSFTVTVTDAELPQISCPGNLNGTAASGTCAATMTFTSPVGTDNCPGATTALTGGLASGSSFPVGTTLVKFTVTDASGNTNTCSFNVSVTDAELPVISCPGNMSVGAGSGQCSATVTFSAPVGTDNCAGATTVQLSGLASGSNFPIGTTANVFRVTDASGNSSTCGFNVVVTDNQVPSITCPGNLTANTNSGSCTATVNYTAPIGTDNCPGATTTLAGGLASGSAFPLGVSTVTYQVSDAATNSATCSFTVTVSDVQAPTWSGCPTTVNAGTGPSGCTANVNWTPPSASDNCTIGTTNSTHTPGSSFPTGTTAVVYTATDAAGNTATCSFNVIVTDNVAPTALCNFAVVNLDSSGNGSITAQTVNNGSSDNCSAVTLSLSQVNFTCADAGNNVLTLTVTDASGNTSTCTANVSVVPPTMIGVISADTTNCGFNLSCAGANDGVAHAAATGGCPSYTYLWSNGQTTSTATGLSSGLVTVTITDGTGATDVQTITLTAPVALSATSTTTNSCPGGTTGSVDLSPNGGNSCQSYNYLWSNGASTEDLSNVGPGSYTVTITDANGCTFTTTATVAAFAAPNPSFSQSGNLLTSLQAWSSYQWLLNGGPISGATSISYTVTQSGSYSLQVTDANGCTGVSAPVNVTFVGVDPALAGWDALSLYPNPARSEVRLRAGSPILEEVELRVHDVFGKTYLQRHLPQLEGELTIGLSDFSAGTYMVELKAASGMRRVFKLVVQ